ncbi:MAG: dihydroneopterin aldolase [Caldilineaceae bacterium]
MTGQTDKVFIRNLMVRGIVGINPDERKNRQDILINIVLEADTRMAAGSDHIDDAINYRTVAKSVIAHIENGQPQLVERLAEEIADICLGADPRVLAAEVTVEKPGAVRFAESVGVSIFRTREA